MNVNHLTLEKWQLCSYSCIIRPWTQVTGKEFQLVSLKYTTPSEMECVGLCQWGEYKESGKIGTGVFCRTPCDWGRAEFQKWPGGLMVTEWERHAFPAVLSCHEWTSSLPLSKSIWPSVGFTELNFHLSSFSYSFFINLFLSIAFLITSLRNKSQILKEKSYLRALWAKICKLIQQWDIVF